MKPTQSATPGPAFACCAVTASLMIAAAAYAQTPAYPVKAVRIITPTAAGGSLDKVVRLGLYLTDLGEFAKVNAVMQDYFQAPYPARSTIEVSGLPKGASFEVDAVMVID